jgi:hypothetical protein
LRQYHSFRATRCLKAADQYVRHSRSVGSNHSSPPLYRTSHRGRLLDGAVAGLCHLLHRLEKVASTIRDRRHARGIKPSAIL